MAEKQSVKDLLEDEIKDLYSAEKQLTKAIPKMAKGSHDAALAAAFKNHLKETEGQVARLEEVGASFHWHEVNGAHAFLRDEGYRYDPALALQSYGLALELFHRKLAVG